MVYKHLRSPEGPLTFDATNTMGMAESCVNERLHAAMLQYDHLLPDGMPLVWCMRWKGAPIRTSVAGPILIRHLLGGLERPTRIAVVGGHREQHREIVARSRDLFPNARFVSMDDVPYGPVEDRFVTGTLERIERSRAELVFVCLGVPRQYYWTALAKPRLGDRVSISVGGAFSYLVGEAEIAPRWMQQAGLWWVHRLAHDPRRLAPRYFKYNPLFLRLFLTREVLTGQLWRQRPRERG
jgi:N-acetylglucosaminyldiphosphoundecaprenol N-acetyl-beta-D-mannosaminyltransferase